MAESPQELHKNEDVYALNAAAVEAILAAMEAGDRDRLIEFLGHMHPADVADLLEQIEQPRRIR